MHKVTHTMCTTWAKAAMNMCIGAGGKYSKKVRECTNAWLSLTYPTTVHGLMHTQTRRFLSVIGQVIPTIHSAYKEPKTFKFNNTNTKPCGEQS